MEPCSPSAVTSFVIAPFPAYSFVNIPLLKFPHITQFEVLFVYYQDSEGCTLSPKGRQEQFTG